VAKHIFLFLLHLIIERVSTGFNQPDSFIDVLLLYNVAKPAFSMSLGCSDDSKQSSRSNIERVFSHFLFQLSLFNVVFYNIVMKMIGNDWRKAFGHCNKSSNEVFFVSREIKIRVS